MRNEYEELKKQGYTEEEIELMLDNVSRMTISDQPLGPGRDDRGVTVTDSTGLSRKTSSIMMGYNKQGIVLENGEYVSWEEVQVALGETLQIDGENVVYACKKTGKIVEPPEIVAAIFEASVDKTYLTQQPTDKITNQQAAQMALHADGKTYPKGVAMLGNDGMKLPSGEYVSKEEIELALQDYVRLRKGPIITPPYPPIPPLPPDGPDKPLPPDEPEQPFTPKEEPRVNKDEEKYRVIKRIFYKASILAAAAIAAITTFLAGLGMEDVTQLQEVLRHVTDVSYDTSITSTVLNQETSIEAAQRMFGGIVSGQGIEVPEGAIYRRSPSERDKGYNIYGTIGQGRLQEGSYNADGFAVLHDGVRYDVEWEEGKSLAEVMEGVSKEKGIPIDELVPMVHISDLSTGKRNIAGWLDARDTIDPKDRGPQTYEQLVVLDDAEEYTGSISDFQGDFITIERDGQEVQLRVRNEDGSFVKDGDMIVGSDGETYQMNDIEVVQDDVIDVEEVVTGQRVNWKLSNISLAETLAIAGATALALYVSKKIPRKEMTEMTGTQIDELTASKLKAFEEARGEYEGRSLFVSETERLLREKINSGELQPRTTEAARSELRGNLISQDITVEDITTLGEENTSGKRR